MQQNNNNNTVSKSGNNDVRSSNIIAAKSIADTIRTSLGPRGMDKMITSPTGDVVITNDGATILEKLEVQHPAAKMLVELSKAQDVEAGDGTSTVVVIAGSLLSGAQELLNRGIPPATIVDAFMKALQHAIQVLEKMAVPIDLGDRENLLKSATTSLNSKVVSQYSSVLSPIAVDAVLSVIDPTKDVETVNLSDIRVSKQLGATIEETELVDGLVFTQKISRAAGGPTRIENAKIGLIQFCLSSPKTNMENNVIISDYTQMDRFLAEEKKYTLNLCNQIKKSGCNVLLIQKSILRDAVSDLSLTFLAKLKILVVRDIERDEIEFICKSLGCQPIANIESFKADRLGSAKLVEEVAVSESKIVKITGVPNPGRTISVLCYGSNKLVLDEAERSLHDALCVVRSLVKKKFLIAGGGAPEIEVALQLTKFANSVTGLESNCIRAFAESLEIIPFTLAENAGLNPIAVVTELRNRHSKGETNTGINVRKGVVTDIVKENVVQPLLVSLSALTLATETVAMILKIDDIVAIR